MAISGDFAALKRLEERLSEARMRGVAPKLAQRIAAAAKKLVADEFRQSRDPYGNPWAPVNRNRKRDRNAKRRRGRSDKPLIDTGRMRASVTAQRVGDSVRVSIGTDYAVHHQFGAPRANVAQRAMLPMADLGGLGPIWTEAFQKEADRVIAEALTKG